jgi:hypothetical protein
MNLKLVLSLQVSSSATLDPTRLRFVALSSILSPQTWFGRSWTVAARTRVVRIVNWVYNVKKHRQHMLNFFVVFSCSLSSTVAPHPPTQANTASDVLYAAYRIPIRVAACGELLACADCACCLSLVCW